MTVEGKGGRPKKYIDWKLVENLCKIQCTQEEIASICSCSLDTIERRSIEDHEISFAEYFKEKRLGGRCSLRRNQWKMAEKNPTMALWLGKQYLDQKDKQEVDQTNTIAISIDSDDADL